MQSNVAEFYKKVYSDTSLQQKIMADTGFQLNAMLENSVKIGAEMGYEFSLDEAREFGAALEELPEEMLEAISAGSPTTCSSGAGTRV